MTREEAVAILIREIDEDPFIRTEHREQIHEALNMAIEALEQEPCEDCISRQAVLEKAIIAPIAKVMIGDEVIYRKIIFADDIEKLPSVNPQESKTGCWEKTTDRYSYWYRCSCCGERIPKDFWGNNYYSPYCPECGAQMAESEEE